MIAENIDALISKQFEGALQAKEVVFNQICSENVKNSDNGMQYWLSLAPSLLQKPERGDTPSNVDPLALPEPSLLITPDLDGTKEFKLVLNKFPVVPNHSLLVTNEFKLQSSALMPSDLITAFNLIVSTDDVNKKNLRHMVIYNSGPRSGSSLDHKHLQLLELPENFTPFQENLCKGHEHFLPTFNKEPLQDARVSFAHFVLPLPEDPADVNEDLLQMCYISLLQRTLSFFQDWNNERPELIKSYNVLLTKRWICLIPRSSIKAKSLDIGFNSIGYAGLVLVKKEDVYKSIKTNPNQIDKLLLECGFPNTAGQKPNEYNY